MKEGSKLYPILYLKCPRCHKGRLFTEKNPYKLDVTMRMDKYCSCCSLRYEMETGFFFGSMYVSYGLSIAFSVAVLVAMYVFSLLFGFEFDWINYLIVDAVLLILLMPVMFRLSRALWLGMFISYDPAVAKSCESPHSE